MPFQYSWPNLWAVAGTLIVACALLIFRWNADPFKRTALAVVLMQSICITYAAWKVRGTDGQCDGEKYSSTYSQ